jgi:predicted  nucleic acid-binding Zn-ribbon protein
MRTISNLPETLEEAVKVASLFNTIVSMLQGVIGLEKATGELERAAAQAEEDRDEARAELVRLEQVLKAKQAEVEQAVEGQSARTAEEVARHAVPIQEAKDKLRNYRNKMMNEMKQMNGQLNDLDATKKQLEATLKKLEGNVRARQNEAKGLEDEMTKTREAFTQEKRNMERELAKLGDTEEVKERRRLAVIEAQKVLDGYDKKIREKKATLQRMEKIDRQVRA